MDFEKRIKEFRIKEEELKKEFGVGYTIDMSFPQYNILPEELELALLIIKRHNPKALLTYTDQKL